VVSFLCIDEELFFLYRISTLTQHEEMLVLIRTIKFAYEGATLADRVALYRADPKRMYLEDGCLFLKIIERMIFSGPESKNAMILFEHLEGVHPGCVLADERGNEFKVCSYAEIRNGSDDARMFSSFHRFFVEGNIENMGEYVALIQNVTMKQAYTNAKRAYKKLFGGTCVLDQAWEGDHWWFFHFYNFFLHPAEAGGTLRPREAGGKFGYTQLESGGCLGVQVYKKGGSLRMLGSGQIGEYHELRNSRRKILTEEDVFYYRRSHKSPKYNHKH